VELHIANGENRAFLIRDAIRFINDRCFEPPVLTPEQVQEIAESVLRQQT